MIIVAYAVGAASPTEISKAAEPYGGAIFLTESTDPLVEPAVKVLQELGPVIGIAEGTAAIDGALDGRQAHGVVTFADAMLPVATAAAQHFGLPGHGDVPASGCGTRPHSAVASTNAASATSRRPRSQRVGD